MVSPRFLSACTNLQRTVNVIGCPASARQHGSAFARRLASRRSAPLWPVRIRLRRRLSGCAFGNLPHAHYEPRTSHGATLIPRANANRARGRWPLLRRKPSPHHGQAGSLSNDVPAEQHADIPGLRSSRPYQPPAGTGGFLSCPPCSIHSDMLGYPNVPLQVRFHGP